MGEFIAEHYLKVLVIIGLLTILFILAALFTSLTEEAIEVSATEKPALDTPEFRRAVESIAGSARPLDSGIEVFADGNLFLADLITEIEGAERSVTITNYIFHEGEMTDKVFGALRAAAERGIAVRLLLDDHGANSAPKEKIEAIEQAGGRTERFRPVSFRTLTRIHRRTHVRAIVIDGVTGYAGGLAFQDEWMGDGMGEKEWRDLMFKFGGSLARATQDHFNALWRQTDGEILTGTAFYPPLPSPSEAKLGSYFISLLHAPAPDVSADLLDMIWLTISGAEERILLATPYLTPPEEIVLALKEAVLRGVIVEILVPGPHTDTKIIQSATRSYYEDLLEAGVKIYEYQPGRFHEKFLTADSHWSLIGSANMDNRSASLNVENVFGIEDKAFAGELEKEFAFGKEHAHQITAENFRPSLLKRAWYRTIALFTKQF